MEANHQGYGIHITARRVPLTTIANRWYVYAVVYPPVGSGRSRNKRLTPMGAPFASKSAAEERALKLAIHYIDRARLRTAHPVSGVRATGKLVGRDGIEPPTPGFSVLKQESWKYTEILAA
jgi:hypothetical protein